MPEVWSDISNKLGDQSSFKAMVGCVLDQDSQALKKLDDDRNGILHCKCCAK
jgi:hypothetical protein